MTALARSEMRRAADIVASCLSFQQPDVPGYPQMLDVFERPCSLSATV